MNVIKLHDVLGLKARDTLSGTKGIIESVTYSMSGSIQYGISSRGNFAVRNPETWSYDFQQVEKYPERWFRKRLNFTPATPRFQMGEAVQMQTNEKIQGFVYRISIFMNGCVAYTVVPFDADKIDAANMHVAFEPMWKSIQGEEGVPDHRKVAGIQLETQATQQSTASKPAKPVTGGPANKVERPL